MRIKIAASTCKSCGGKRVFYSENRDETLSSLSKEGFKFLKVFNTECKECGGKIVWKTIKV